MTALDKAAVIVPTLNAGPLLDRFIPALLGQSISPDRVFVIDSESTDDTVGRFRAMGANVRIIPRGEFNHGGTRKSGTALCPDAEFLVFFTQDAIPVGPESVSTILSAFDDPKVGMAYGRQLPRPGARAIETHARLVNYPDRVELKSLADRERLGIKTIFCSNSFAAYRRTALEEIGNFSEDMYFAEDSEAAAKMLLAGWLVAYRGDAQVYHSHGYTILEDFRRYFDVGVFHSRNPWLLETFGRAEGEGARLVMSELRYLMKNEPLSIPSAVCRAAAKYAAYRVGILHRRLPLHWRARLGMNASYWRQQMAKQSR